MDVQLLNFGFFVFLDLGILFAVIGLALILCRTADRIQLAVSYRLAQRRLRTYDRHPLLFAKHRMPEIISELLRDKSLRQLRNIVVTEPRSDPQMLAIYKIAHLVPPEGGILYSGRRLRKLGLIPFARANTIEVFCINEEKKDRRVWSYNTKTRRAYPLEIGYGRLLSKAIQSTN